MKSISSWRENGHERTQAQAVTLKQYVTLYGHCALVGLNGPKCIKTRIEFPFGPTRAQRGYVWHKLYHPPWRPLGSIFSPIYKLYGSGRKSQQKSCVGWESANIPLGRKCIREERVVGGNVKNSMLHNICSNNLCSKAYAA